MVGSTGQLQVSLSLGDAFFRKTLISGRSPGRKLASNVHDGNTLDINLMSLSLSQWTQCWFSLLTSAHTLLPYLKRVSIQPSLGDHLFLLFPFLGQCTAFN